MKESLKTRARKYLDSSGTHCPYCGSDQYEGGSISVEAGSAGQFMKCNSCEKTWEDNYRLSSVSLGDEWFERDEHKPHRCKQTIALTTKQITKRLAAAKAISGIWKDLPKDEGYCPECGQELPASKTVYSPMADMQKILDYLEDEKDHYEETGHASEALDRHDIEVSDEASPSDHIYCSIKRVQEWLEHPKVQVLVGLYGGIVEPDPQVFFNEDPAIQARDALDKDYGIVRDHEGHYEHPENEVLLYEVEIK